jgi:hypothetical protein
LVKSSHGFAPDYLPTIPVLARTPFNRHTFEPASIAATIFAEVRCKGGSLGVTVTVTNYRAVTASNCWRNSAVSHSLNLLW